MFTQFVPKSRVLVLYFYVNACDREILLHLDTSVLLLSFFVHVVAKIFHHVPQIKVVIGTDS